MIDGFVLAGGRSRRMGVDKARVPYPGRWPMAVHVAGLLEAVCGRVALVRTVDDGLPWRFPDGRPLEIVYEGAPSEDRHPLWGVAAALSACRSPRALLVPCDVPWLTSASLARLAAAGEGVAWDGVGVHPLVAAISADRAASAETLARSGAAAKRLVDDLPRVEIAPAELADLSAWAEAGRPGPVRSLLARLPWLAPEDLRRVRQGELSRLAARGVLDPEEPTPGR